MKDLELHWTDYKLNLAQVYISHNKLEHIKERERKTLIELSDSSQVKSHVFSLKLLLLYL